MGNYGTYVYNSHYKRELVVGKKGKSNVIGLDQKPLLTNCWPQGHVLDVRTVPPCHNQHMGS